MSEYVDLQRELELQYKRYLGVTKLNGYQWWGLVSAAGMMEIILEGDVRATFKKEYRIDRMEKYLNYLKMENAKKDMTLSFGERRYRLTEVPQPWFMIDLAAPYEDFKSEGDEAGQRATIDVALLMPVPAQLRRYKYACIHINDKFYAYSVINGTETAF